MNLQNRIENYKITIKEPTTLNIVNSRIEGLWIMGNNYTTKGGYGAYPHGYIKRISALFPEMNTGKLLHLFSASIEPGFYIRFDSRLEYADVQGDAHNLSEFFPENHFDIISADPPYSVEDSEHYGTPMVKRKIVFNEALKVLKPGGYLIWLDQVLPMYSKDISPLIMAIGMIKSTNHRVRGVFGFQKEFTNEN